MIGCDECKRVSRRTFLRRASHGLGGLAIADPLLRSVASSYAFTPTGTGNLLVLCQLHGGLDALSLLAPFTSSVYQSQRPTLALNASQVAPLPDHPELGLTNNLEYLSQLYADGDLAIVQQVGYPNGNHSHFECIDIFEYGVRNVASIAARMPTWYERLRRLYFNNPYGVLTPNHIGNPLYYGYPHTSQSGAEEAFSRLTHMKSRTKPMQQAVIEMSRRIDETSVPIRLGAGAFESTGPIRGELWRTAALASANLGTQIFKTTFIGFDSHGGQSASYSPIMTSLNAELRQFVNDLKSVNLWNKTCIVLHTEFGRRNLENASQGTDHGYGGHMVLIGPGVRGGLFGQSVTSNDLLQESLPYYVDFRAVYGQVIQNWLGFDPAPIFNLPGESFDPSVGANLFA